MQRYFLVLSLIAALGFGAVAHAQDASKAFTTQAYAVDAETLSGEKMTISLWGIDAPSARGTAEALRGRAYLDDLIAGQPVRCLAMGGSPATGSVRGRCLNTQDRDLSLMMIGAGLAAVNRHDLAGNDLSGAYLNAERQARAAHYGLWATGTASVAAPLPTSAGITDLTQGIPLWALAGVLLVVPVLGFLIIGLIMHLGLRQLITLQRYQLAGTQKRERALKEREKYVIASALESELMTNRAKLDAFLVIYEELLKSLRDPSRTPKYQRAGDIIHEKPALTRSVYDAHVDKLDLLGPQLSSDLSNLYALIVPNPDYKTIEPEFPIEKARDLVDRVVRNAERLIEPLDKVAGALAVIVRDKRSLAAPEA